MTRAAELSAATTVAAVIGHPIRHSRSPRILNAAFAACGLDWAYVGFDVAEGGAGGALDAMRTLGLGGLSVTMPHKQAVHDALEHRTVAASRLRAVNCVAWEDGHLVGLSTDGDGFVRSLLAAGHDPAGARCLVVGAGGAARAVVEALGRHGAAQVAVAARRPDAAADAAALAGDVGLAALLDAAAFAGAEVIVQSTPVGMADTPGAGELAFDPSWLRPGQVVADLVYHPLETPVLAAAAAVGAEAVDGLGMLVHQAALAFETWTGQPAPIAAMDAAARA